MSFVNQLNLPIPVNPINGGTGTSNIFSSGSVIFSGSSGIYNQNNPQFFWDNSNNRLGIGTNSPSYQLHVQNSGGTAICLIKTLSNTGSAILNLDRDGTTSQAYLWLTTSGTTEWVIGTGVNLSSDSRIIFYSSGNQMTLDTNGNLVVNSKMSSASANISGLTASLGVFTDSSKNLTTSGTLGVTQGGMGSTSYTAASAGALSIPLYNGSTGTNGNFQTGSDFNYNPTQGILQIISSSLNPGIATAGTNSSSSNLCFISASRASSSNGSAQYRLLTGSTNEWTYGTFSGNQDLSFLSNNGANTVLTLSYSNNRVTINTGDLVISNSVGNLSLGSPSLGGGQGVIFIQNASQVPTSNPSGGGVLYVQSGALKYRGTSGTITTIALA